MKDTETNKTVGKVEISLSPESKKTLYSDGDVENQLLELFQASNSEEQRESILSQNPTWPEEYHLSYGRENLLNWVDFDNNSSVLEVGAGCGALTGVLIDKFEEVVALELSSRRAEIIAARYSDSSNLKVIGDNVMSYSPSSGYDAVTSIGVLEYAPSYVEGDEPSLNYLKKLHSLLNDNGVLVLAIENKTGLKYWAGAPEDHTGELFEGLQDYPNNSSKVRTFGRKELDSLLKRAGFARSEFYYPFPDYKLPMIIYSEDYYPGNNDVKFPLGNLPSPATDRPREVIFSEAMAMKTIEKTDLYQDFANSFLVFAYA